MAWLAEGRALEKMAFRKVLKDQSKGKKSVTT